MKFNRKRLVLLRKMMGWGQIDLAQASGLSRPYITQIENGTRSPSPPALAALAEALHVQIADLVDLIRCPKCGQEIKLSDLHR